MEDRAGRDRDMPRKVVGPQVSGGVTGQEGAASSRQACLQPCSWGDVAQPYR